MIRREENHGSIEKPIIVGHLALRFPEAFNQVKPLKFEISKDTTSFKVPDTITQDLKLLRDAQIDDPSNEHGLVRLRSCYWNSGKEYMVKTPFTGGPHGIEYRVFTSKDVEEREPEGLFQVNPLCFNPEWAVVDDYHSHPLREDINPILYSLISSEDLQWAVENQTERSWLLDSHGRLSLCLVNFNRQISEGIFEEIYLYQLKIKQILEQDGNLIDAHQALIKCVSACNMGLFSSTNFQDFTKHNLEIFNHLSAGTANTSRRFNVVPGG